MRVWGSRRVRTLGVIALAAVAAFVVATVAVGHHVDSMFKTANYNSNCGDGNLGDQFCQTDNAGLTVFREASIGSTGRSNIASALNGEYAPTDLSVTFQASPSYTGGSETDIIYRQGTVPGTDTGIAWCNDSVSSTKCDQHYNQFDSANPSAGLACHETGHAVGLTHGQQASPQRENTDSTFGCMKKPTDTSNLGVHNTNQVNATYPN